jgi:hypothetical protein
VDQAEADFDMFADSYNLGRKKGARFASNVPRAWKSLWAHPMILPYNVSQVEASFGPYGYSVSSTQDRCTVCAERTVGL